MPRGEEHIIFNYFNRFNFKMTDAILVHVYTILLILLFLQENLQIIKDVTVGLLIQKN